MPAMPAPVVVGIVRHSGGVPASGRGGAVTYSTNDASTFSEVAEDRAGVEGSVPPERTPATVTRLQYEMLADAPYRFTSDEVVFGVHAARSCEPAARHPGGAGAASAQ